MKLKTAVFYQSVKNWDGNESNTFKELPNQVIELEDHLVKVSIEGRKEVIVVPTANLRYAIASYEEAYNIKQNAYVLPESEIVTVDIPSDLSGERVAIANPQAYEEIASTVKKKKANAK
jgi:hypothetical protein